MKATTIFSAVLWCLAAAVLITTALPFTNSATWWIRMWDFPRLHIAISALCIFLAALPFIVSLKKPLLVLMALAIGWQSAQISPYSPIAATEIELAPAPSPDTAVSLLSVNVLMENKRHSDLIAIIEREDPDVLFLMETDKVWQDALDGVLARYPFVKSHIADNHYGLIFATRLDPVSMELMWPAEDNTPAVKAVLNAPNGVTFNFIGLHPRPPVPGNDTEARDRQIRMAALMTASTERPTVCMGDFNDVAWSWTSRRFKQYGEFLDPRVGRGMMSSFHAGNPLMRFPIDHFYLTKDVRLVSFDRLEAFGSDHFPMHATVYFEASSGKG